MRFLTVLFTALLVTVAAQVEAQNALRIVGPDAWPDQTQPLTVEVRVDNDAEVSTIRLAIGHDENQIQLDDLSFVLAGSSFSLVDGDAPGVGGVIGQVVLDTPLAPGTDQLVATITYSAISPTSVTTAVTLAFEDGVYGDPVASNQLVLTAGGTIGASSGLGLENYLAGILGYSIGTTEVPVGGTGTATIFLTTDIGVQGFQISVAHPAADLTLEDVDTLGTTTETAGAEFTITEIFADGGTMSVILDFDPPFDGQVIDAGLQLPIANYTYSCANHPLGSPATEHTLTFVDGVFGGFPVSNVVVAVDGTTLFPGLGSGIVRCSTEPLTPNAEFFVGRLVEQTVIPAQALPGAAVDIGLFYSEPDLEIDGFNLALTHGCALTVSGFDLTDSALDSLGVEFIGTDLDADSGDGDGCEIKVEIVLDADPPFDGQRAPASVAPLQIGTLQGTIPSGVILGTNFPIEFVDGVDGSNGIPLDNGIQIFDLTYGVTANSSVVQAFTPFEPLAVGTDYHVGRLSGSTVVPSTGLAGAAFDTTLFYRETVHAIEAFNVALSHDAALTFDTFTLSPILDSVGVEFVEARFDSDPDDGDGSEVQVRLVFDDQAPFDGQTAPVSTTPTPLGTLAGTLPATAAVGETFAIDFTDGVDADGATRLLNGVLIEGITYDVDINSSFVEIADPSGTVFNRGDCNVSGGLDIADAVFFLTEFIGSTGTGTVDCRAACDANGDTVLDIADAIYLLQFLAGMGTAPPAPFGACGVEPGADCAAFDAGACP